MTRDVLTVHCKRQACRAVLGVLIGPDTIDVGMADVEASNGRTVLLRCKRCREVTRWMPETARRSQEQADARR